jgi:MOSC domain-containing protein YiiM
MFAGWMAENQWIKRFADAGRPGAYLRVLREGTVSAGGGVTVVSRPARSITICDAMRAYYGARDLLPRLVSAPGLSRKWETMARQRMDGDLQARLATNVVAATGDN